MYIGITFMKHVCLLTWLFIAGSAVAADTTFTVSGRVTALHSGQPLKNVNILLYGSSAGTVTDSRGAYSIVIRAGEKASLAFSYIGYRTEIVEITQQKDHVVNVKLRPQPVNLKEVPVTAMPEVFHGTQEYNIIDYELFGSYLGLIVYEKRPSRSKLLLVNDKDEIIASHLIPETPSGFFKDCLGNIHIVTDNYAFQAEVTDSVTFELYPRPAARFNAFTKPCVASIDEHFYFAGYGPGRMSIQYIYANEKDSVKEAFRYVEDTQRLKMYLNAPQGLASLQKWEQDYLRAGEAVPEGLGGMIRHELRHAKAIARLYFGKPVFAPLKAIDKNIYLFNHYDSKIEKYTPDGKPVSDLAIDYHKQKNWENELIVDPVRHKAYTCFFKNGLYDVKEIDLASGNLKDAFEVKYKYAEKIRVIDGALYYLYKPFESQQKKYLYRQR